MSVLLVGVVSQAAPASATPTPSAYIPVTPVRIADTGSGMGLGTPKFAVGETRQLKVTGLGNVPATGVAAVAVQVTAVNSKANGGIVLYKRGTTRPNVSHLTTGVGENNSNLAFIEPDSQGYINVYNSAGSHVVVETQGYFTISSIGQTYEPLTPQRLLDTRIGLGRAGTSAVAGGSTVDLSLAALSDLPADATALFAAVTVIGPSTAGRVGVWDANRPNNPIYVADYNSAENTTSSAAISISSLRRLLLRPGSTAHLTLDVFGFFRSSPSGSSFTPYNVRMMDTRFTTVVAAGKSVVLETKKAEPLLTEPHTAMALNVHAWAPSGNGNVRVWPEGTREPVASVTFSSGENSTNLVIVPENEVGRVLLRNNSAGTVHLIVDLQGWFFDAAQHPVGSVVVEEPTGDVVEVGSPDMAEPTDEATEVDDGDVGTWTSDDPTFATVSTPNGQSSSESGTVDPPDDLMQPEDLHR